MTKQSKIHYERGLVTFNSWPVYFQSVSKFSRSALAIWIPKIWAHRGIYGDVIKSLLQHLPFSHDPLSTMKSDAQNYLVFNLVDDLALSSLSSEI